MERTRPSSAAASLRRRELLCGTASVLVLIASGGCAKTIEGAQPWMQNAGSPPHQVEPGGWQFFTQDEAAAVEVLVDRLIPPDAKTPGAKDAGVAVFIDRQLAGSFGSSNALYMRPPFADGTPQQGLQSPLTPSARYRQALAALDRFCRQGYVGKAFAEIPEAEQIALIRRMENASLVLDGANARGFFELLLQNTKEGFFADPVYGGNRGMVAWKMIGFPGARYDYRDWVGRHNETYPLPPVGIGGRAS